MELFKYYTNDTNDIPRAGLIINGWKQHISYHLKIRIIELYSNNLLNGLSIMYVGSSRIVFPYLDNTLHGICYVFNTYNGLQECSLWIRNKNISRYRWDHYGNLTVRHKFKRIS